jgi:arginase family enzyme
MSSKSRGVTKTTAVIFPFDLFGSGGAGAGADLVADELDEILADNRRETVRTRARAYTRHVQVRRFAFDSQKAYETWRPDGRQAVRQALQRGDFLLWVAGNHLGALPVYDELAASGDGTLVVQFDAHLDVHHFADCTTEPSHGNFLLHCAGPLPALVNAGHRELLLTPEYVGGYYRRTFGAAGLAVDDRDALAALAEAAGAAERVFIDIDCDVLDPAFFPAVTQPVPFGLAPQQLVRLLEAAWSPKVAGVFVSEFDPGRDRDDRSLATLMWLIEYVLLRKYE